MAGETINSEVTISAIISNINAISKELDMNIFIQKARSSFKENIQEYEVADDEKAKMIATYEANISAGIIKEIMQMAKELPEIVARIDNIKKETNLKDSQEKLVTAQKCTEIGKKNLVAEQISSEKYRHRDLKASTAIKVASLEVTKQQAKFEEARRYIALEANYQNAYMKKADYKVQQLQAIATDDDIVISTEQISDAKTTIDAIPTTRITYTSDVTVVKPTISDDDITTTQITCEE